MSQNKQKVAILGGGMGSVVAAYQLTSTPELRDRYDVTLYQMGWRLGGKCASGRNAAHRQRIEEHGLHLWLGFYHNASRVMRDCLEELDRSWDDAFIACHHIALFADFGRGPYRRNFELFPREGKPGDPVMPDDPAMPGFWSMVHKALSVLREGWKILSPERPYLPDPVPAERVLPNWLENVFDGAIPLLRDLGRRQPGHQFDAALHLAERRLRLGDERWFGHPLRALVAQLLRGFADWLWDYVVKRHLEDDDLCLFFTMVDTAAAMVTGIVDDRLIERGFDAANGEEFRAWLRRHGAHDITLERGPLLKGIYDMAFAYEGGDINRPNAEAGTAAHALLRLLFTYKGPFYWRMKAGMGDTVFAPFYEVLRRRGVHFRFFHCVTRLGLSDDRRSVDEIDVIRQVELTGDDYQPLVVVKGMPCWPSEPCWDQVVNGEQLQASGVNLEHDPNPLEREPITLKRTKDFDLVVLGIPVGALEPLCGELIADARNPRFRAMIEHSATTMTQGFQVWLNRPGEALGWEYGDLSGATAYGSVISSYAPMTHLVDRENWPAADDVQHVGYFCGVLPDEPGDTHEGATKRAKEQAVTFLESEVRDLWPKTAGSGGRDFDWDLLVDPQGRQGSARFDAQFCVANFPATERYVLTPAGSVQYRLRADQSGYNNLYLTGDWVRTGLDSGCIEAAAMAGMQAARAISGVPQVIVGEHHGWVGSGTQEPPVMTPKRPFVEFGGLASWPPPVESLRVTLFAFVLEGDQERLANLCRRVFADPTDGQFDYRPLGSKVVLTFSDTPSLSSARLPYSRMGYATERQASLWVPVAKVRRNGAGLVVEGLRFFVPFMWVDNPFSLTSGREVFGYPKTWGEFEFDTPPPGQTPERLAVEAYGSNLQPGQPAGRRTLLEVIRTADAAKRRASALPGWFTPGAAVEQLRTALLDPAQDVVVPDLPLCDKLFDDLCDGGLRQLFLKQFRSSTGPGAAIQQIVEAPIRIKRLTAHRVRAEHRVVVHDLKSHPLEEDLGLATQTTRLVVRAELDFTLEDGEALWTRAGAD